MKLQQWSQVSDLLRHKADDGHLAAPGQAGDWGDLGVPAHPLVVRRIGRRVPTVVVPEPPAAVDRRAEPKSA